MRTHSGDDEEEVKTRTRTIRDEENLIFENDEDDCSLCKVQLSKCKVNQLQDEPRATPKKK